jgi:hypothetical protein
MSTKTVEIKPKAAGPAGSTEAIGQSRPALAGFKVRISPFMLEDHIDAIAAKAALADPENREHVNWEELKARLGL